MIVRILLALLLVVAACDNPLPSGPTPPPTTSVPIVTRPPRVDQPFSVESYRGIIAFGLGHPGQSDDDILRFANAAMSHGWNTVQKCAETEYWDGPGYPTIPRDPERLREVLDLLARVPGLQVALIGNCTLKRQVPLSEQLQWAEAVARVAAEFQNVAIFTHNEFDNCRGRNDWGGSDAYCAGKQDVAAHVRVYRSAGIQVVTADDSFSWPRPGDPPSLTYGFRLKNIGASPASFHPDREKAGQPWDPSPNMLRELGRHNGLYILSETVAWMDYSGNCNGLRTCDRTRIENYIATCAAEPTCRFTFHCENCLAGEVPTWIPEAR